MKRTISTVVFSALLILTVLALHQIDGFPVSRGESGASAAYSNPLH